MEENPKVKRHILKSLLTIVFMLLLSVLGAYLGFQAAIWCFDTYSSGIFEKWQQIPNPPYETTDILAAGSNGLFVQTTDGIYLNSDVYDCLKQSGRQCWRPVNEVDKTLVSIFPCSTHSSRFRVAAPPVPYVQYLMQVECGGEYYDETYYLRRQNGDLWVWQWGNFSMGMIGPFVLSLAAGVIIGLVAGLLVAKGLISLWGRLRQKAKSMES